MIQSKERLSPLPLCGGKQPLFLWASVTVEYVGVFQQRNGREQRAGRGGGPETGRFTPGSIRKEGRSAGNDKFRIIAQGFVENTEKAVINCAKWINKIIHSYIEMR
ncbi:MAG: hypothetical protein Q4C60_04650 [Eubacteriales bacterium]|nr:hypothetical protein [Eubacteriales bacterium]